MNILSSDLIISEVYPKFTYANFAHLLTGSIVLRTNEAQEERFEGPIIDVFEFLKQIHVGNMEALAMAEPGLLNLYRLKLELRERNRRIEELEQSAKSQVAKHQELGYALFELIRPAIEEHFNTNFESREFDQAVQDCLESSTRLTELIEAQVQSTLDSAELETTIRYR
jgi:hypothetical protein